MNSWEVSLLNKLYKTTEGFKPLEKLFLQERIDFNSVRKDIIKTYKDAIRKDNLEYLQNNYITNIIDLNYQITSSIQTTYDQSLRYRDDSSILGNPVLNESVNFEFLALATRDKIKNIEVALKKPIIHTEDDVATLLNICTFLAYKEAIEHSYSFVQILNEIKTKNERRFLSQGLEYIDVLVLSALGRCRSWKKISKEARSSIPLLFEWFENIRKEQKEAIDMNAQPIATQSQKDQKSTKQKPVRKNDNSEFLDSVKKGDIVEVERYLASGINVECADPADRNKTAYHIACEAGNLEMVKLLDKYNSNPEARDCEEMTPIFFALASENRDLIEYLVAKGVNLEHGDFQSRTPFYWACSRCSVAIVEYLYHKKCNINTMSKMQRNALSKTSYMGRTEIVKFLLSCPETQVNHTGERGRTALHMAVWGKAGGRYGKKVGHDDGEDSPEVAMLLLSHGADVNLQDLDGNTALNTAAASCAEASIPVLLRFGADLNIVNNLGETPLYKASQRGYLGVCSLLFETGKADPFIKSQTGNDCLEVSIANQYYKLVQFYIEKLAKILDENDIYFDNICYRIAKTFKANEAVSLLMEVFSRKQITENMVIRKETLESLVNLKSEKVLDLLVPWLKVISDQGKMKENIQYALDIAFKCKWIGCFKYFSSVFPNEVAALLWKATDINLDLRTDDALYLLKHFNIDIFAKTDKNETVFHLLVSKKNTQVLSCISKLLMSALQGVQEDYSEQGISNIYLQNINLTDVVMFLNAKNSHGHSASELAVINKFYDVSAILERLIGEKLESLFTIPSYKLEVSQENNANLTHKCKEKLVSIENQFKLDSENTSKIDIDIDDLFFRLTEEELNYFKSVTNNASHVTQHSPYTKIISERKIVLVDSENSLKEAVAKLSKASLLGVDMECYGDDSTKVSFVCLVQISTIEEDFIIDTLKLHPIINQYLEPIFISENILKVFHGCDNDLKWLKSNFDIDVVNIFDTGRAYMLLNNENVSVSLAWLTMNLLKVELNKAYQRADWRVRPLPQVMLDYARGDSCVILYIWYILCSEIKGKENSKIIMLEMTQKMARKCWKAVEEGNIPRIKVIPLDS